MNKSKALRHGSWASVVYAPVGLATLLDVMLYFTLADQIVLLQIFLAHVGSFLERAEAALSSLSLAPALSQTTPMSRPPGVADVGSIEKGDQELYGCFSPRVGDSSSSLSASSPMLSTIEGESVVVLQAPVL